MEEGEESVELPFRTTCNLPKNAEVDWSREDPKGPLKVHKYKNGTHRPEEQDELYRDRTVMKENPLKSGDVSLTLKHPTNKDSGEYICEVFKVEENVGCVVRWKTVLLEVKGQYEDTDL